MLHTVIYSFDFIEDLVVWNDYFTLLVETFIYSWAFPAGNYMLKVSDKTLEQGVKYVKS